jgi:hypothetical protein
VTGNAAWAPAMGTEESPIASSFVPMGQMQTATAEAQEIKGGEAETDLTLRHEPSFGT